MAVEFYEHQKEAIDKLKSGAVLVGGVGSGKSRTAIGYYYIKECGGKIKMNGSGGYSPMRKPKDLYIITTAMKRDSLEWEKELSLFLLSTDPVICPYTKGVKVIVDSWNKIKNYVGVKDAFFIFDEQRVVGSGTWVKSFLKITKVNNWILLSATPGDTWLDYVPVFIANGFYKNRSEFMRDHVIFSRFSKYPKIDRYINTARLARYKQQILVRMSYQRPTVAHHQIMTIAYDKEWYKEVFVKRWNVFTNEPIKNAGELCLTLRRIVNSHGDRLNQVYECYKRHGKIIVFYNFDYELEMLRRECECLNIVYSEWNGHKHERIPNSDSWVYLVQYAAGAEGWNCVETNTIVFYSQNYSYRMMTQAAGRIDRMNTKFSDLYYYHLRSSSTIDLAIAKAISQKKDFNENKFLEF